MVTRKDSLAILGFAFIIMILIIGISWGYDLEKVGPFYLTSIGVVMILFDVLLYGAGFYYLTRPS
jgi:hypothetical protein